MYLSHSQRFDALLINSAWCAPLTLGCASMTQFIDRIVFKKTKEEKAEIWAYKKQLGKTKHHKFELQFKGAF